MFEFSSKLRCYIKSLVAVLIVLTLHFTAHALVFPLSTEMQIGKIKNLVDKASNGIYLTVGGERAFRGSSQFEGIEHLVIVDKSPVITRFNKINTQLLKAPDKELYKDLRWSSDFASWQQISPLLTKSDFKWWDTNVRKIQGYDIPEVLNKEGHYDKYLNLHKKMLLVYPKLAIKFNNRLSVFLSFVSWPEIERNQLDLPEKISKEEFDWFDNEKKQTNSCIVKFIDNPSTAIDWGQVIDYKSGNYLFDDKLYARLHNLAMNNNITIVETDLSSTDGMNKLMQNLQQINHKIAILDLDNLYEYWYMGEEKFQTTLFQLIAFGTDKSILILMNNYKEYTWCDQFSIYLGFTFEHIAKSWPKYPFFDAFISSVPEDIRALMDGRLYEANDQLPLALISR